MGSPIASETLLTALKKRDCKWLDALAQKLGKPVDALKYEDVSDRKFGPHTMALISNDIEWSFGVCLPLSVSNKQWRTMDCLEYLVDRTAKPKVNLKLAQSRRPTHNQSKVSFFAIALLLALGFPVVFWQFLTTSLVGIVGGIFCLGLFWVMSLNAIATERHYRKLEQRIKTLHGI